MHLGEVAGVAVNSKGHIFVYSRGGSSAGPAYGNTASQILEFMPNGKFLREIGKNLYAWAFAHTVRIDKDDNIWAIDKGSDMVVKFNPQGRVHDGVRPQAEASDAEAKPHERNLETPLPHQDGRFRQPTDVAWDPDGNDLHHRRLREFARRQDQQGRRLGQVVGPARQGPGRVQPRCTASRPTPRATSMSATATTAASRCSTATATSCARSRSTCRSTQNAKPAIGNKPDLTNYRQTGGSFAPGAPWAICITPPPNQVLYSSDSYPGRIYKLSLDGKVLGVLGKSGKQLKQFGWIHEMACPSENELFVAEILNWRVQKLILHPEKMKAASRQ